MVLNMKILVIATLMFGISLARRSYGPTFSDEDMSKPWCATRPEGQQCCEGKDSHCSVPINGTICFCDKYCNGRTLNDCCPDYRSLCKKKWDGLRVKWGPNVSSSDYFSRMPRTTVVAEQQGFHKISDCDISAPWRGQRYITGGDYATVLLFDVNGYIAGIQTSIPNNLTNGFPKSQMQPPFVADGNRLALSAYFVDPSIICGSGRTSAEFESQGTGTDLYLQLTENPEDSKKIPHYEYNMAGTKWTEGKCFNTMGNHYWYDLKGDMSCDDFVPFFLLYNSKELTAFGFALIADLPSNRYEHPTPGVLSLFMKTPPTCLNTAGTLSTTHIYLTSSVVGDQC